MKQHTIYKQIKHVQIGHLYEHLYCHQLTQAFRDKGLFAYVDYSVNGRTYYDGYVEVEVLLFSKEAIAAEHLINQLSIEIDEDTISGGLLQIMAEKRFDVWDRDDTVIGTYLAELDAKKWTTNYNSVTAEIINISDDGLEFTQKTQRNFLNMTQKISLNLDSITIDKDDASALFVVISKALRENLQEEFARSLFCYSVKDTFTKDGSVLTDINTYRVDRRQASHLTDEGRDMRLLLDMMRNNGFIERLSDFLLQATADESFGMPNQESLRKKVGLTLDATKWHSIGTVKQLKNVFNACSVELKLGKSSTKIMLSEQ